MAGPHLRRMWKGWIPGALALAGAVAWLGLEPQPQPRSCGGDVDCAVGERCAGGRCQNLPPVEPIRLLFTAGQERVADAASCGDGLCDLAAGECEGICPADCQDVPCALPCSLDGVCDPEEGASCPDCYAGGCNFDGLCTVGESPRCPDCSCGDGYCDTAAGECVSTCARDCPETTCERLCDFDAVCEAGESEGCPDCTCGDGVCEPALEDCEICPLDCGACPAGCGDGICTPEDGPDCADCNPEGPAPAWE